MPEKRSMLLRRTPLLSDRIAEQLFSEIMSGRYKRGERLPTERELAETYGVSRPIVREALGHLRKDNIIVSRQGSGAFIADEPPEAFRLKTQDMHDDAYIHNVVELLSAVEAAASGHAAVRRTKKQLEVIRRRFDEIETAIIAGGTGIEEDIAFHRAIVEAAQNPIFRDMLHFLDGGIRSFIRTARLNSARFVGLTSQVQEEHAIILKAIEDGDAEAAHRAAHDHLANALQRLSGTTEQEED